MNMGATEIWFVSMLNGLICLGWPLVSLVTLLFLCRRELSTTAQAVWSLTVVAIPFMGALAFWIINPKE
jgi:hypothetical protein